MKLFALAPSILTTLLINTAYAGEFPTWVGDISLGATWENGGHPQTLFLAPEINKTYVANKTTHALFNGELF